MTNTIRLDTGIKKIKIEVVNGNSYDLTFNPNDTLLIEQVHALYFEAMERLDEIERLSKEHGTPEVDERGMPLQITPVIEPTNNFNVFMKERLTAIFGNGLCKAVYGETMFYGGMLKVYPDLLKGLLSFAEPIREEKVAKFIRPKQPRKAHTKK